MDRYWPISKHENDPNFSHITFGMITVWGRNNSIYFNYKNPSKKFHYTEYNNGNLTKFLEMIPKMKVSPRNGPIEKGGGGPTPLDLEINNDSLIVFSIPNDSNMQFSSTRSAITSVKEDNKQYSNLKYVTFNEKYESTIHHEPVSGCKTIFFHYTDDGYNNGIVDKFNIHIEIMQTNKIGNVQCLPIILDPEVRNPG